MLQENFEIPLLDLASVVLLQANRRTLLLPSLDQKNFLTVLEILFKMVRMTLAKSQ